MSAADRIQGEINDWVATKGQHWHNSSLDFFWSFLEAEDIQLASGNASYEDMEILGVDDALAIFSVDGVFYALSGSYSSWGSDWDNGVHAVEKRTITIERWETL